MAVLINLSLNDQDDGMVLNDIFVAFHEMKLVNFVINFSDKSVAP